MALDRALSIHSSFNSSQPSTESWLARKAQQPGILAELCEEALSYPACAQGDTFHQVLEAAIMALIPLSGSGDSPSQQLQQWQAQQEMQQQMQQQVQQQANDLVQDRRRRFMELMQWDNDDDSVDEEQQSDYNTDVWQQQCQDSEDSSSAVGIGGRDSSSSDSSFCASRAGSADSTSSIESCQLGTAHAVREMAVGGSCINSDSTGSSRGQASSAAGSWMSSRVFRGVLFAAAAAASAGVIIVGVRRHAGRR